MAETGFRKWIITITVIVASLLELIDTTIVNVSLPDIQGNLGATLEDVAWVVTGYAVANVIILPMSGWLGSRFGRKQYFITSIIARAHRAGAVPDHTGHGRRWLDLHFAGHPYRNLAARADRYRYGIVRPGRGGGSYCRPNYRRVHNRPYVMAVDILC